MVPNPLQDHGRAIIETAKDHLVAALESAPDAGWTAVEWAEAGGLLIDEANFPAVFAHHLAPVLVKEGRALVVEEGGLTRYTRIGEGTVDDESPAGSARAAATTAPQVWNSAAPEGLQVDSAPLSNNRGVEPVPGGTDTEES
ncbi:MAG: hypothetical protein CL928_02125 [Deltaproteobacteria bacterium]|nr:hypothetical protein [Deltaproteobacteria bacterium]